MIKNFVIAALSALFLAPLSAQEAQPVTSFKAPVAIKAAQGHHGKKLQKHSADRHKMVQKRHAAMKGIKRGDVSQGTKSDKKFSFGPKCRELTKTAKRPKWGKRGVKFQQQLMGGKQSLKDGKRFSFVSKRSMSGKKFHTHKIGTKMWLKGGKKFSFGPKCQKWGKKYQRRASGKCCKMQSKRPVWGKRGMKFQHPVIGNKMTSNRLMRGKQWTMKRHRFNNGFVKRTNKRVH